MENFFAVEMMGLVNKRSEELSKFNEDSIISAQVLIKTESGEELILESNEAKLFFEENEN